MNKLAILLVSARGNPDGPSGRQVSDLITEAIRLCAFKAIHDHAGMRNFYLARMEEGKLVSGRSEPPDDLWPGIVVSTGMVCDGRACLRTDNATGGMPAMPAEPSSE